MQKISLWSLYFRSLLVHTYLSIKDDGKGFDVEAALRKGNGLQNLQRRAEIIGAKLNVKSIPGKGTEYTIVIKPLKDE